MPQIPCAPEVSAQCPSIDPSYPVYLPDPGDCTKYCVCSNGVAFQKECLPGLVWDTDMEVCNWPAVVSSLLISFYFVFFSRVFLLHLFTDSSLIMIIISLTLFFSCRLKNHFINLIYIFSCRLIVEAVPYLEHARYKLLSKQY